MRKFGCNIMNISCPINNKNYLFVIIYLYNGEIGGYKYSSKMIIVLLFH